MSQLSSMTFFVLLGPGLVYAQGNPLERERPEPPVVVARPKAVKMVVPEFIKPGARITYRSGSSQESNDPRKAGLAAKSIKRFNVIAVLADRVILQKIEYLESLTGSKPYPIGADDLFVRPADVLSGSALWMMPAQLKELRSSDGIRVDRGPYPMHGTKYSSVILEIQVAGAGTKRVYDAKTGLKLVEFSATGRMRRGGNVGGMNRKTRIHDEFETYRHLKLPWYQGKAPAWTQKVKKIILRGSLTRTMPGLAPVVIPRESEYLITERVGDILIGTATHKVLPNRYGVATTSTQAAFVSGPSQTGGLWIDPAVLEKMKPGLVDKDPVLGSTLSFSIEKGKQGQLGVLVESHPSGSYRVVWGYDLDNGILKYTYLHQAEMNMHFEMVLAERQ